MPLQQTSGNVTADAFGGGVAAVPNYIEDVFSTWLYTGTGATNPIVNGLDISTKGGLVWIKDRGVAANHFLFDTVRGVGNRLSTSGNFSQQNNTTTLTAFNTTGFTLGTDTSSSVNQSGDNFCSWSWRKQPKFFDVQMWTGTGSATTIAHSLGSVPGCIIVKRTDTASNWQVYHNGLTSAAYSIQLNLINAQASATTVWNSTTPTSAVFSIGTDSTVNASGGTYIAYIYAHNAGGFGLTGTNNVISCGSYTTDSTGNATVNLGYEPQFLLTKRTDGTSNWYLIDTMRGATADGADQYLLSNTSVTEALANFIAPNATGFTVANTGASYTYIYIAIRRGPMKVPTDATKVFAPIAVSNTTGTVNTTGFPVDLQIQGYRPGTLGVEQTVVDRLRGASSTSTEKGARLITSSGSAESVVSGLANSWNNTGFSTSSSWASQSMAYWNFQRAPGFFDEVCYTGIASTNQRVLHNLTVPPELIIVKARNQTNSWWVYNVTTGRSKYAEMQTTNAFGTSANIWGTADPTSTDFGVNSNGIGEAGFNDVAYLFATCTGVSKVFSFTGNGTTQTINCGFAAGARFVLLKATSATGGWYVYDTARGMTVLTDPYLLLNSTAAEVATLGSVTTATTGFAVNEAITTGVNTNGVSYIGLAIA